MYSNFMKILIILDVTFGSRICFKIGKGILYILLNKVCKFQEDWKVVQANWQFECFHSSIIVLNERFISLH